MKKFGILAAAAAFGALAFAGSAMAAAISITVTDTSGAPVLVESTTGGTPTTVLVLTGADFLGSVAIGGLDEGLQQSIVSSNLIFTYTGAVPETYTIVVEVSDIDEPSVMASINTLATASHIADGLSVGVSSELDGVDVLALSSQIEGVGITGALMATPADDLFVVTHTWVLTFDSGFDSGSAYNGTTTTHISVPEPGILGLFGFGLLGMGIVARRRKAA